MFNPLSKEELLDSGNLCEHCPCTEHGSKMGARHISAHNSGCEGAYCDEAYEYYLNNFEEDKDE